MIRSPEILSPAGSWESLTAAAAAGADAVYFGAGEFNARRNATNFTEQEVAKAVAYCHERGIKVYFTLNTVLFNKELYEALKLAALVCDAGADAFILQDAGIARLIAKAAPGMKLHASTQMSAHNLSGVMELAQMGFSRVVLARELSASEIAEISAGSPVELELFVHGAHCMSVSGQCYMSAFFGGRSGNRGVCAQPCRLPFSAGGAQNVLSLKDLSLLSHLRDLSNIGDFALKIEGRRKRPEYVAAATAACVKAAKGEDVSREELDELKDVFSRDGFTQGYYEGKRGRNMFGTRTSEDAVTSAGVQKKFRALYEGVERPRVPVDFDFTLESSGTALFAKDGDGHEAFVRGAAPERARSRELSELTVRDKLCKTGGTPFFAQESSVHIAPGFTVPVAELNRLRRETLDVLLQKRGAPRPVPFEMPPMRNFSTVEQRIVEKIRLRFLKASQIPVNLDANSVEMIFLPLSEWNGKVVLPEGIKAGVEIPRVFFGNDAELMARLEKAASMGIRNALCGNVGAINCARRAGLSIHGDFGLNVTNAESAETFRQRGAKSCVVSFETPAACLREIAAASEIPCGAIVYGRLPLMLVRNCPVRSFAGCRANCAIKDRTGCTFPVACGEGKQYSEIFNSRPLWLSDVKESILKTGIRFQQFYFMTESAGEVEAVLDAWKCKKPCDGEFTRGLYSHPVS